MSAEMDSSTKTVYVELLDEGTKVVRPTQARVLSNNVYQLRATPDYDPNDEHWEFLPGTIVRCAIEVWNGDEILVARELVA